MKCDFCMPNKIIDGPRMEPEPMATAEQSKTEQEEIFEIARDLFTPAELALWFGWKTEVDE